MKKLWRMMHDYQEINVVEKGISFTEEGFTQLFDETVKAGIEHIAEIRVASRNGIFIGAASVGLVWLGVAGYKKFKKRNLKEGEKVNVEDLEKMGIKFVKPGHMKIKIGETIN